MFETSNTNPLIEARKTEIRLKLSEIRERYEAAARREAEPYLQELVGLVKRDNKVEFIMPLGPSGIPFGFPSSPGEKG